MRQRSFSPLFGLALLLGGCPKRQTTTRVVYVPAPPSASAPSASAGPGETLTIEEPAPPAEPQEAPPPPPLAPKPAHRPRRANPSGPNEPVETPEAAPEPGGPQPTVEIPALEPRSSREQEAELFSQTRALQNDVQQQVAQLEQARLSATERKTLDDARTFLTQSRKAMEEGDLQRSLNLARKASLLTFALIKER